MKHLILFLLLLTAISCQNEEQLIDNSITKELLMISTDSETNALMLIEYPENKIISNDIYFENNSEYLPSPVERFAYYRGLIYLIMPQSRQIFVIDENTYKKVGIIDFQLFSIGPLNPKSICFANATDAYICHYNSNYISLIDLTNFQVAKNIDVKKEVYEIACAGNQVYLSNWKDDLVSVLDTRTDSISATIEVGDVPTFIDFTKDGTKAYVVCTGEGKIDSLPNKTKATGYLIDVAKRSIIKISEIGSGNILAIEQIPTGVAITNQNWAFVPTQSCLLRLDTRGTDNRLIVERKEYVSTLFNYRKDKLFVIRKNGAKIEFSNSDPVTGKPGTVYELPQNVKSVLPL